MKSIDNDHISIKLNNIGKNKVTIMVVKENKYGDIEYLDDMIYNPTLDNQWYSFQLHKLQNDIEDRDKPKLDITSDHLE